MIPLQRPPDVQERDASVQRVLWVDVLNLLALDGAHGERARALLDASGALRLRSGGERLRWPAAPSARNG